MNTIQGIILKAIPYKDFHRIITVFSPNRGLVPFMIPGAFSSKKGSGSSSSPLTTVEITYRPKDLGMANCDKIEIVNAHLGLRQNLAALEAACEMLRALTHTQLPEKEAEPLYQLLQFYLQKLPESLCPATLSASFILKLLRYEGILTLPTDCEVCQEPLSSVRFSEGEFLCSHHSNGIPFHPQEYLQACTLGMCEKHSQIASLVIPIELKRKIDQIFLILTRQ